MHTGLKHIRIFQIQTLLILFGILSIHCVPNNFYVGGRARAPSSFWSAGTQNEAASSSDLLPLGEGDRAGQWRYFQSIRAEWIFQKCSSIHRDDLLSVETWECGSPSVIFAALFLTTLFEMSHSNLYYLFIDFISLQKTGLIACHPKSYLPTASGLTPRQFSNFGGVSKSQNPSSPSQSTTILKSPVGSSNISWFQPRLTFHVDQLKNIVKPIGGYSRSEYCSFHHSLDLGILNLLVPLI